MLCRIAPRPSRPCPCVRTNRSWCKLAQTAGVQNVTLAIHATKGAAQMLARLIVLPFSEEKAAAARRLMRKNACK